MKQILLKKWRTDLEKEKKKTKLERDPNVPVQESLSGKGFQDDESGMSKEEYLQQNHLKEGFLGPREEVVEADVVQEISRTEQTTKHDLGTKSSDNKPDDSQSPFLLAMEAIKKKNIRKGWVPDKLNDRLQDIDKIKIEELKGMPDHIRDKFSDIASSCGKMDATLIEKLARISKTEIHIRNASKLTKEDCLKIFESMDTSKLTVLQLDSCGNCMSNRVFYDIFHKSSKLATLSLKGANQLSDLGITTLALCEPPLQSINLSQCSRLTCIGINFLAQAFRSSLRELYIDECRNIDPELILPDLKKLQHLEVLSVAKIQKIDDVFVSEIVETHGNNIKELVFADCKKLTDKAVEFVGKSCPNLCAIDLTYLNNLTDLALQYLADSCRSIRKLILRGNNFSDEAVAAFLEVSGESLNVLSLNRVHLVGWKTAESIAKYARNWSSLDLSRCCNLTDEDMGLIVDSCASRRELRIFGCTQITDVFVNGHSNRLLDIIGYKVEFEDIDDPY